MALICGFAAMFGAAAPAGAVTESFALSSASVSGQSSIGWQVGLGNPPATPNAFPDQNNAITLAGQIDSTTGAISGASLTFPPIPQPPDLGQNPTFTIGEVRPGSATGTYDSTTGAVTLNDALTITLTVEPIGFVCTSPPVNVALTGTWSSDTQNVTLATTSSFTIPQFSSASPCSPAATTGPGSLNASPGGVAGSVGNSLTVALHGQFAPGLPTTTTLSASPNSPQLAGTSVGLSATVTDPSGQGTPTGTVTFLDNGASIGTGTLSSGTATLSTTTLPGGTNQLSASYGGDSNYAGSTSSAQSYAIQPKPSVSASLPSQATLGAGNAPVTLTIANPASGNTWSSLYLQVVLTKLTQSAGNYPTLSYEDSAGNMCPLTLSGTSTLTAYYSGAGAAPCGTPPASFSLNAGTTLTVPLDISYPSSALPGTQTVTATLYSGSCTSATSCTAMSPLSGSAAPKSAGSFPVAPTARVALSAMSASVDIPDDAQVPQGFWVEAVAKLTKPTTPSGMPKPTGTVTCAIDGGPTAVTETAGAVSTDCDFATTPINLVPGTHTITVTYSGDSTYLPDSTSTTFTVTPPPPGVSFTCTLATPLGNLGPYGATLQVQTDPVPADVPANSTYTMSGIDITFNADDLTEGLWTEYNGYSLQSLSATLSDGQTITSPQTPIADFTTDPGDHVATQTFSGFSAALPVEAPGTTNTTDITSFSFELASSIGVTCNNQGSLPLPSVISSGTTLAVTPDSQANVGAPVTMTATAYPTPTSSTGGGQVDFYDGTTDLATVPVSTSSATATFTTAILSTGIHQLTAVWSGNLEVSANASNTVDYQVGSTSTTTLTSSANPANAASPITFTATVNGASGGPQPTGDVAFSEDGTTITGCMSQSLSTASPPTATCKVTLPAGQTHAIVATYSGDASYIGSTSDTLTQTTLPGTNTSILSTKDPSPPGNVTFWSGVSPSAGAGATPTGTVAFSIDGSTYKPCASQPLGSGGGASCTVSFKAGTTHKVFATYAGSASYSGSKSNTLTQTVTGAKSSTGPKTTGGSATLASGKTLTAGQSISAGSYKLVMQGDGNLVEYQGAKALWASGTSGHPGAGVTMQKDGNLVVYAQGKAIWASKTAGHTGSHLTLQGSDGNVVIYGPGGKALWATGT